MIVIRIHLMTIWLSTFSYPFFFSFLVTDNLHIRKATVQRKEGGSTKIMHFNIYVSVVGTV